MKSAYELAMERLQSSEDKPRQTLTPEQKEAMAEIERVHKAKFAERDVFLQKQLVEVRLKGLQAEEEALLKQVASERQMMEETIEAKKQAIRDQSR